MSIWFRPYTLEELDGLSKDSMVEYLDIRFTEIGPDYTLSPAFAQAASMTSAWMGQHFAQWSPK